MLQKKQSDLVHQWMITHGRAQDQHGSTCQTLRARCARIRHHARALYTVLHSDLLIPWSGGAAHVTLLQVPAILDKVPVRVRPLLVKATQVVVLRLVRLCLARGPGRCPQPRRARQRDAGCGRPGSVSPVEVSTR
jgi:hypothetical protein